MKDTENLLKDLEGGFLLELDVPHLAQECPRFKTGIPERLAMRYSLALFHTPGLSEKGYDIEWNTDKVADDGIRYPVYMDTPIALGLMFDGKPVALSGFVPLESNGSRTLMIYHLMGVRGRIYDKTSGFVKKNLPTKSIVRLDWEKFLVDRTENVGGRTGFDKSGIRSGYNNPLIGRYHDEDTPYLEIGRALKKYDAVAERLGYTQGADRNWYKCI